MTKNAKTATAAAIALVSSIALMLLMQAKAPHHATMFEAGQAGTHPMSALWGEMGWMMALGPIAIVLFLGAIVTLAVLFVRTIVKPD